MPRLRNALHLCRRQLDVGPRDFEKAGVETRWWVKKKLSSFPRRLSLSISLDVCLSLSFSMSLELSLSQSVTFSGFLSLYLSFWSLCGTQTYTGTALGLKVWCQCKTIALTGQRNIILERRESERQSEKIEKERQKEVGREREQW